MNNGEETELGFTRGKVARELRQALYKDFTEKEVETIAVVLLSHLLVEDGLDKVIFTLLSYDLPLFGSTERDNKINDEMNNAIWQNIQRMSFIRKLEMIKPALERFTEGFSKMLSDINRVRNDIFHGRISKNSVIFKRRSIWDENGIEKYFESCQDAYGRLLAFYSMIDSNRAVREKWAEKLKKLEEPLY